MEKILVQYQVTLLPYLMFINIKTDQNEHINWLFASCCFSEDLENVDVKYLGSEVRNMKEYYKDEYKC